MLQSSSTLRARLCLDFRAVSALYVLSGVNRTHDLRMMGVGLAVTVLRDTPSPPRGFKFGGMRGYDEESGASGTGRGW